MLCLTNIYWSLCNHTAKQTVLVLAPETAQQHLTMQLLVAVVSKLHLSLVSRTFCISP